MTNNIPHIFESDHQSGFESQWKKYSASTQVPLNEDVDVLDFYVVIDGGSRGSVFLDKVEFLLD